MIATRPRLALALFLSLLVTAAGCGERGEHRFQLTLLHTNDVHARVLPFNEYGTTCSQGELAEKRCFGGVARRATMIERIRDEGGHVMLLDGGDQFQGTLFYNRFKGQEVVRIMNHLRYDGMVVGNHEFDDGPEVLARFAAGLDFPLLGANVDTSAEPLLADRLLPYFLANVGGETLAVAGVITEEVPELSRPGPTLHFLAIEPVLDEIVGQLEAQGIDKIIVLSHSGLQRDRRIAAAVSGVDVIIGGHTNTLLSNTAPDAEGPYPVVVTSPRGEPVLIVQDFAWGKYLGRLDVTFDRRGIVTAWSGDPILLDASVPEDPETAALLADMTEEVEAFSDVVLGSSEVDLVGDENTCRFGECNLGNLIVDAMLEAHPDAEIALHNGGGIRASVPQGDITVAQVLEVLPFGNTVSTFSIIGTDLLATLEHGVSEAENPDNDGTGRFLQVAGLRYTWTAEKAPGERILSAEVREDDDAWLPVDPQRVYRVLCSDFTRNGGDGFTILRDRAIAPYDQGRVLSDVVQDYLMAHSPVHPTVGGRIERRP